MDLEGLPAFLGGSLGPGCGRGIPALPGCGGLLSPGHRQELGGSPSAAGGLRRRRYEQPGPAVPDPGLVRVLAAAPARAPPGARAPVPAPARAELHRGIAAPPSGLRAPARLARGSALRLARRRPPLCPPRLARAHAHAHKPRRALPPRAAGRRFSPRGGSGARRPHPAFRPRWVLAPVGCSSLLPPPIFSRSEPTRGRERG